MVEARALRQVLGRFTTGVTVVTAIGDEPEAVRGMTANAFTSVSMRPPLVLVSIATTARMNACIERSGRYGVSVLAQDQEEQARRFAGLHSEPEQEDFRWWDGVPLLTDALMHVTCSVHRSVPAGDHTLFLGEVQRCAGRDGRPLVFYAGGFRCLDNPIDTGPWWL